MDLYPVFRQFTKFHIMIDHCDDIEMAAACRVFRALIKDRQVTLKSTCNNRCVNKDCGLEPQNCAVLRCTSFEKLDEADAVEVTSIICSGKPVDDTYAKCRAFERMIKRLPQSEDLFGCFDSWWAEELHDMMFAAMEYNNTEFKRLRIFLLGKV